jgi:DNA-binding transcriptional LysR family regulator
LRVRAGDWVYDKWEFESKGKAFEVQVKGSLIMTDAVLALDATLGGAGLMYLTEDAVADKIKSGKLEVVLRPYAPRSVGYFLYFPKRSQVQSKLRAFLEHIKDLNRRNHG